MPRLYCDRLFVPAILFAVFFTAPLACSAATTTDAAGGNLTIRLEPPIFQVVLAPGTEWSSTLRVTNQSTYPITLFTSVENFNANGETGMIVFSPRTIDLTTSTHELASWITTPRKPVRVEAGKAANIPFSIRVPANAEPGGHYAGILVGTEPLTQEGGGAMGVESVMSSLLLVKTTGEVRESGYIRDFSSTHYIVPTQEATLTLHFANTGNVHLTPHGEITIQNMFGRDRGTIEIDNNATLGHILPNAQRNLTFTWKGEKNFLDIGRYRAFATLHYGENNEKTAYYRTAFWVIPIIPFGSIVLFVTFFILFGRHLARRSIARRLAEKSTHHDEKTGTAIISRGKNSRVSFVQFAKEYSAFIFSLFILLACLSVVIFYFTQVLDSERDYEMVIQHGDGVGVTVLGQ